MLVFDADYPTPNIMPVRMFIYERGGLAIRSQMIRLAQLENRSLAFRETINRRGEVPALRGRDGQIITETVAICEYLDEVATGGLTLIGRTAEERAHVRMWTRRVDLEIAQPIVAWWRSSPEAENMYMGFRILELSPEHQRFNRRIAEHGLNMLNEDLADRDYICGSRMMLADILLFSCMLTMSEAGPWINNPNRQNVSTWFGRMNDSESAQAALASLPENFEVPAADA